MVNKPAKCISFLGTGSDVGKSIVVTAVCRILKQRGFDVAPFKAQNMSNNSYVTLEGGEMGRAQIVQAEAAGVEPHTDMNPVLLKPNTDCGSQVVLQGHVYGNAEAADYFKNTGYLFEKSKESLTRLRDKHEVIVMEGAGSCGEVNLRSRDFVNFESAHAADAPVILVADINTGGVFAQIVGTLDVIPPKDRARVAGFVINKFRGDPVLFEEGIRWLEEKTGLPALGLIPWFQDIDIDSEDGMPLETVIDPPDRPQSGKINIAVIRLPHISNFTDFAPLQRDPAVRLHFLRRPRQLTGYDAVFLPGTKSTRGDLEWLRNKGWEKQLQHYAEAGGQLAGVCGGYQMLGKEIADPDGTEGVPGSTAGLGLLDIRTVMQSGKTLSRTQGTLCADDTRIDGYEIHMGKTTLGPDAKPLIRLHSRNRTEIEETDGAENAGGSVWGTYFHGLFDFPEFRRHFLKSIDSDYRCDSPVEAAQHKQTQYDLLADHFEKHMNVEKLMEIIFGGRGSTRAAEHGTQAGGRGSTRAAEHGTQAGGRGSTRAETLPVRKFPAHFAPIERFNTSTIIFLTVCTHNKNPLLNNAAMHNLLCNAWKKADAWRVGKYMIMPDHIHLFCAPSDPAVSLKQWICYWKSLVSRAQHRLGPLSEPEYGAGGTAPSNLFDTTTNGAGGTAPSIKIFQRDYWDTQLRKSTHYTEKWNYISENPVRAGLAETSALWPYQGELHILRHYEN